MMYIAIGLSVIVGQLLARLIQEACEPWLAARRIRRRIAIERKEMLAFGPIDWEDITPALSHRMRGGVWNGRMN